MSRRPFCKNMIKEMFLRDYAVMFVMIFVFVFVDVLFSVIGLDPKTEVWINCYEGNTISCFIALLAPFFVVYSLLRERLSPGGRDLFYSLPATRRDVLASVAGITAAYAAVFLILDNVTLGLIYGISKSVHVQNGYFLIRIISFLVLALIGYGLALLSFSLSHGESWYWILSATLFVSLCLVFAFFGKMIGYHVLWTRFDKGKALYDNLYHPESHFLCGLWAGEGTALEKFYITVGKIICHAGGTIPRAWFFRTAAVLGVLGAVLTGLGCFAYQKIKPERVEGRSNSPVIHVALQGLAVALIGSYCLFGGFEASFSEVDEYADISYVVRDTLFIFGKFGLKEALNAILNGLLISLPVLFLWEALYQGNIRKWKRLGTGLVTGLLILAMALVSVYV